MSQVRRRQFLIAAGALYVAPLGGQAQQPGKIYRIGWLGTAPLRTIEHLIAAFEQGLRDHGYVVGSNAVIKFAEADGKVERLPDLARELVLSGVDVIVCGTNPNTSAAMAATKTIPIIFAVGTDVIGAGYVKSFAKPGGNITGITWDVGGGTVSKAIELLKEVAPKISRVAVLYEPPYHVTFRGAVEEGASANKVGLVWLNVVDNPERAFAEAARERADAAYLLVGPRIFGRRAEVAGLALKHRLPSTYVNTEYVDVGGLLAYAPNISTSFREAARYVDRILKGAKPGDLPVEQPTKYELAINLKTAKVLGLTIPHSLLLRADRVIE